MNFEIDDTLDDRMLALMEKQKKVKESQSMEKLMAPSNSLRSLYSDILSVKLRPSSAGKLRKKETTDKTNEVLWNGPGLSPQRGKIRPQSAPSLKRRKDTIPHQIEHDTASTDDDIAVIPHHETLRTKLPLDVGKFLNKDTWWEDFDTELKGGEKKEQVAASLKSSRSAPIIRRYSATRENKAGAAKTISSTERAKKYRPNFDSDSGHQYLKNAKKREKQNQHALARKILEEANIMQAKCYTSVEEANSYAKYLGIRRRYSVFIKDACDHVQSLKFKENLKAGANFDGFGTIDGASNRIGKMSIEVVGEPGEPTTLISMEKFFREHEKLYESIRKHRSLIPLSQQIAEAKCEKQHKNSSPIKNRRRGGLAKAEVEKVDEAQKSESEKNAFVLPRSPTTFVDFSYDCNNITSRQQIQKLGRKETEEYLRKILDNTVNVTRVLEEQLAELQSRGWNDHIV